MLLLLLASLTSATISQRAVPTENYDDDSIFSKISDVWFMTVLIAVLMMFIKKFEWSVCASSLLTIATTFVTYVFIHVIVFTGTYDSSMQAEGVICAITAVIAIGVFIGYLRIWQYFYVGILFAICYSVVKYIDFSGKAITGIIDPGGAINVHMFAAYWGVGVALALQEKRSLTFSLEYTTHSVAFVWLASILLWILWPSFVTMYYKGSLAIQGMNACYMAGAGSMISAFIFDYYVEGRINAMTYTYALLGGCVGISSSMFIVGPWGALLVGFICGAASSLSFNFLHPWIQKHLGFLDVTGVHNLHGVCSWCSVIIGLISDFCIGDNGLPTLWGALVSFSIALASGAICGFIFRFTMGHGIPDEYFFNDHFDFIFSEDEKAKKEAETKEAEDQIVEP